MNKLIAFSFEPSDFVKEWLPVWCAIFPFLLAIVLAFFCNENSILAQVIVPLLLSSPVLYMLYCLFQMCLADKRKSDLLMKPFQTPVEEYHRLDDLFDGLMYNNSEHFGHQQLRTDLQDIIDSSDSIETLKVADLKQGQFFIAPTGYITYPKIIDDPLRRVGYILNVELKSDKTGYVFTRLADNIIFAYKITPDFKFLKMTTDQESSVRKLFKTLPESEVYKAKYEISVDVIT